MGRGKSMTPARRATLLEMLADGNLGPTAISRNLGLGISTVKRIAKDVREGGDGQAKFRGRTGKGPLARASSLECITQELDDHDGQTSVTTMQRSLSSAGLDWSWSSVRRMLRENQKPLTKVKSQEITEASAQKRLDWCILMKRRLELGDGGAAKKKRKTKGPDITPLRLADLVWSDESPMHFAEPEVPKNARGWVPNTWSKKEALQKNRLHFAQQRPRTSDELPS